MKIFLDSANIEEIKEVYKIGILGGVTTNPSLVSKIDGDFKKALRQICESVECDVSIEVASNNFETMVEEGSEILKIGKNATVKLPCTLDGIRACRYFSDRGKKVNMTLCFSPTQALLAGIAGAYYISPFVGRVEDSGGSGIGLVSEIKQIYDNYSGSIKTKILAASIRNASHVSEVALIGVYAATMPYSLIKKLILHPLTDSGLEIFNKDWKGSWKL